MEFAFGHRVFGPNPGPALPSRSDIFVPREVNRVPKLFFLSPGAREGGEEFPERNEPLIPRQLVDKFYVTHLACFSHPFEAISPPDIRSEHIVATSRTRPHPIKLRFSSLRCIQKLFYPPNKETVRPIHGDVQLLFLSLIFMTKGNQGALFPNARPHNRSSDKSSPLNLRHIFPVQSYLRPPASGIIFSLPLIALADSSDTPYSPAWLFPLSRMAAEPRCQISSNSMTCFD